MLTLTTASLLMMSELFDSRWRPCSMLKLLVRSYIFSINKQPQQPRAMMTAAHSLSRLRVRYHLDSDLNGGNVARCRYSRRDIDNSNQMNPLAALFPPLPIRRTWLTAPNSPPHLTNSSHRAVLFYVSHAHSLAASVRLQHCSAR